MSRTTHGTPRKANLSLQNTPHPTGPGWGSRCGRRIHPRARPASLCTGLHRAPLAAASHLPGSEAPALGLRRPVRVSARLPPASALKACSCGGPPTARTRPHPAPDTPRWPGVRGGGAWGWGQRLGSFQLWSTVHQSSLRPGRPHGPAQLCQAPRTAALLPTGQSLSAHPAPSPPLSGLLFPDNSGLPETPQEGLLNLTSLSPTPGSPSGEPGPSPGYWPNLRRGQM